MSGLLLLLLITTNKALGEDKTESKKNLTIAFCLTGQLARLELASKITRVYMPNVRAGHTVHSYILLDNKVEEVHQTFWRHNYSTTPFSLYNHVMLENYISKKTEKYHFGDKFKSYIRLEAPSQIEFHVVDGFIPVDAKRIKLAHNQKGKNEEGIETAAARFQNNLRWMNGLRDCAKWIQSMEQEEGFFYDMVVRLRDDTFAFDDWVLDSNKYKGSITSLSIGNYRGINDHNMVIDRKYADMVFRGFTEDYYFNKTNRRVPWRNPEQRIFEIATTYGLTIHAESLCNQPLIPLRANENSTHWIIHPAYAEKFYDSCAHSKEVALGCSCNKNLDWLNLFKSGFSPI
jgi:hypothetical protein